LRAACFTAAAGMRFPARAANGRRNRGSPIALEFATILKVVQALGLRLKVAV
jgi:hypothetical protein